MQLKIEVLKELENGRGKSVSGQALAAKFGVSRNAIWKVMQSLKEEGYDIVAGQNRGYCLSDRNDMLSAVGIADAIRHHTRGMAVYLHKEIDSTNNEAKRLIAAGKTGMALIVSEAQSAGRGRQGKSFFSPARTGVYMTLSFPTQLALVDAVSVTTATAVAVVGAIEELCGIRTEIKWVNDIYRDGKKICGILTEAISDFESGRVQNIVIGIGLNFRTADFPRDLSASAAALNPQGVNRNQMVACIVDHLFDEMGRLGSEEQVAFYRDHSMVIGHDIVYEMDGERYAAHALDIDETGGLVIQNEDGSRDVLRSGEIHLRTAEQLNVN